MSREDDFHKRLERIQESHATGKTVMRPPPAGIRGQKIGLVREKEETQPKKGKAIVARILIMLVIGVVGVRFALAGLADITPEDLDRRQAELWAMDDYGSKAQGAVLMVMGVADPLIGRFLPSPDTVRDALEETVAANLPESSNQPATGSSSATNTAPQPTPSAEPAIVQSDTLSLKNQVVSLELPQPSSQSIGLFDRLFGGGAASITELRDILPESPPSGWQMVREADLLNGASNYRTIEGAWRASNMPIEWDEVPFMGSLIQTVNQDADQFQNGRRFMRLYFNPLGQAALFEYIVLSDAAASKGEALLETGGDEIFIEKGPGSHWFKSATTLEDDSNQVFQALMGKHVLMGAKVANMNSIELKDLIFKLPLNRIAGVSF